MQTVTRAATGILCGLLLATLALLGSELAAMSAARAQALPNVGSGFACPFCDLRGADLAGRDVTDVNLQAPISPAPTSRARTSRAPSWYAPIFDRTGVDLGHAVSSPAPPGEVAGRQTY